MLLTDVFGISNFYMEPAKILKTNLKEAFQSLSLSENNQQLNKCLELSEQLQKRMGVAVYGPPDSGKSTIISLLKVALTSAGKNIRTYIISPKSMDRNKLLGKMDPDTQLWTNGLLITLVEAANSEPPGML